MKQGWKVLLLGWVLGSFSVGLVACKLSNASAPAKVVKKEKHGGALAHYMSWLQRYSNKAGFAILGKNKPLANFYVHEVEETLEDVAKYHAVHNGKPIAKFIKVMLKPSLETLEKSLKAKKVNWKKAWTSYTTLIQNCNNCHQATGYGFLKLKPSAGTPPYNQVFKATSP